MNEIYDLEDITNEKEPFVINTDGKADWACKVIKQEEAELDRLIQTIDEEIELLKNKKERLKSQYENKTGFLKKLLADYFETVEKKELKTCFKFKLPSAELVFVKPSIRYDRDNEKILNWLTENNKYEYIKTNPTVDWAELKKNEDITKIDGVTAVPVEAQFLIK